MSLESHFSTTFGPKLLNLLRVPKGDDYGCFSRSSSNKHLFNNHPRTFDEGIVGRDAYFLGRPIEYSFGDSEELFGEFADGDGNRDTYEWGDSE